MDLSDMLEGHLWERLSEAIVSKHNIAMEEC